MRGVVRGEVRSVGTGRMRGVMRRETRSGVGYKIRCEVRDLVRPH